MPGLQIVGFIFCVIGFGKTRGADVKFSRQAACEPHTPVGLVSPFVFTLSLQTFRLTAHARVLNLDNRLITVPYVFFKIVRIERLPVRTAHLDLICTQGVHMNFKIVKMAARSLKRSILTIDARKPPLKAICHASKV